MKAAELRQAILQTAVQGKLVPQDLHDEPASELLARIRAEKSALIKEGKIKKEKILPPIAGDEVPYDLPDGWVWCRLIELCEVITDGDHQAPPKVDYGVPFLVISNISKGYLDFSNTRYVSRDYFDNLPSEKIALKNDILFTVTGSWGIPVLIEDNIEFCFQRHIALIRAASKMNIDYVYHFLLSPVCYNQCLAVATGTAQKTVPLNGLRAISVPLPPLAEQHRIVAKVDELMALCDELEAAEGELEALEKHFAEYLPKSILQHAVQGKLVPQDLHDEPAAVLLARIRAEKAALIKAGKLKKEKPLPPIAEDEIPYDLPDGWDWCRLGEAHSICRGITFPATVKHRTFVEGTICCATTGSVQKEYNPNADVFVPEQYVKNKNQWLQRNDIIMSTANSRELVGKTCIWKGTEKKTFGGFLTVIRPEAELNPMYSYYVLQHLWADGAFNVSSTQTTNIANINNEILMNTIMPLPSLAEQQRIVVKVDELMTLCDELKVTKTLPVAKQTAKIIEFPKPAESDTKLAFAARGDADNISKEAMDDIAELLGEFDDD